jgi:ketosteroid isomerase-like protein
MRYLFLLFICLNLTPTATLGQSAAAMAVLDTEAQRFAAMTGRDTFFLQNYLANDLVYIHSNGLTETKTAHILAISSGSIIYRSMSRAPGTQIRDYGKWAITNGTVQVTGILNGNPFEVQLRYTAVYRKKRGKWLLTNWQSTRI